MQKRLLFLFMLLVGFTTAMMAQITTSGMSGKVTADGEDVIGATIEVVHVPSGTKYQAVTNAKGMYAINGMRPGGPYRVNVSYIGYQSKSFDNVSLQLGQTYNLNVGLNEDAQQLGEVVVSAKATKFTTEKTGASTNIDNQMLQNMPSVSHSITDYTRLSPYGGNGMSFAGADGRTANFTVDGADFNNNFGLSSNLPGGGSPISIDAIEEMQVVISPFDVRQTNFVGGGLNAITKSGTNTFRGTAYVYHQNEQMRGDAVDGEQISGAREKDRTTTWGMTLGGPIIKNKLFFFVNGEMKKIPTVANRWRGSEDGVADADNYLSRTSLADLEKVSNYARDKYGYNTGSWTSFPADKNNYKLLARLDWNITNQHHLSLRYNYTKNRNWLAPNASSMDGGTRSAYGRTSEMAMSYANSMYSMDNNVNSFSFDLNSRFSNELSNQLLVTYSKLDDVRGTNSSEFPFVDILDGNGTNYISFGEELFTYNNAVHNSVWNAKDDVTWYLGSHKLLGGISFEHQMADNSYMRNGLGYYRYKTLDDFLNGGTPEIVALTYGYNGEQNPTARVQYSKVGIYLQDEWQASRNLKLTYGLRLDNLFFDNGDLMSNQAIYDLDYNGRHIDTGKWPSSKVIFSPRVGFSWDVFGDQSFKLRGGTGLFSGRLPLVFFTNMPTNSGMVQYQAVLNASNTIGKVENNKFVPDKGYENYVGKYTVDAKGKAHIDMTQFNGGLVSENGQVSRQALLNKLASLGYPTTISPDQGTVPSSICSVDPNFHMPEVWKTSLAVDYVVPVGFPLTITAEGIFNKTVYGTVLNDWAVPDVKGFARFNGADSRHIYPSGYLTGTHAYVLENTHKGYGWSFNLSATAKPWEWMDLYASYTHTASKELTGMPGSNAASVLNYMATVDGPTAVKLHNSQYVEPDRIVASMNLHDKSGNHYSFIYEAWRGNSNYSFMTQNDMNGDGFNYDAIYVPRDNEVGVGTGDFRFKTQDDMDRFMAFLHNNSYLKKHQGEYAEAYSYYSPWVHRVDFSYKHDFKLNVGQTKHTLQLSFDMKNVLNFFNSKWGVAKYLNPAIGSDGARVLKYEGVDAEGYATFSTPKAVDGNTKSWTYNHAIGQCWYAAIGLKYYFN
ncbi:MAG: carboxypeptidase regulatory-like domain-containing protein [Prevotella sp.]|nr:carboxypeptidase regulatory-like domain-containing protein [Prevotella sp.]